ncbi:hypothetical protein PGTUg99_002080 [Puccinia graminis f. sp. tritici]|uniref:Uncharacterized protein n=1 Tax=Puccinia graminis f. sp. tritici TaxID=56615 RepID=A0A5B0NNZ4_PUCGR|nr:hypothetical protein PGTUg99_002080 [Puccinia graminis f. sp. tritici]
MLMRQSRRWRSRSCLITGTVRPISVSATDTSVAAGPRRHPPDVQKCPFPQKRTPTSSVPHPLPPKDAPSIQE